jgi:uncharacterized protein
MSVVYLLDINVLLALLDPLHVSHQKAHAWFARKGKKGWATCPLTENGVVRIASHPAYPNSPGMPVVVAGLLSQFCLLEGHAFWPDDISLLTSSCITNPSLMTHSQITDVYLLGLAAHHRGKLATLDRHVPAGAVKDGESALEIVAS